MTKRKTPYIYILLFFLCPLLSPGQEKWLELRPAEPEHESLLDALKPVRPLSGAEEISAELDSILGKLEVRGFLGASLDSLHNADTVATAYISLGRRTETLRIHISPNDRELIGGKYMQSLLGLSPNDTLLQLPFPRTPEVLQGLADHLEEKGNSFAWVRLENIRLEGDIATARLRISASRIRHVDKVIVRGYENFPKNYVDHSLRLKAGSVFTREKLRHASEAVSGLTFAEELRPPEVLFTRDSTIIYLYLKKKRSNRFDGIIGFSSEEESGGIRFNGYLDLAVNNVFNGGETISLFWKNNGDDRQRFFVSAETPYLFGLPVIPKVQFELYRQDSTYSNVTASVDLGYDLYRNGRMSLSFRTEESSDLTDNGTNGVRSYSNLFFGGSYRLRRATGDALLPSRFELEAEALTGSRKSEGERESQSRFTFRGNYLWSINAKNHVFVQNQSGWLQSGQYFTNELFRIGGVYDIRGINEESLFASAYAVFNLEYRYRPGVSGYFYTITDFSYADNGLTGIDTQVLSLGLGYAFRTKIGLFNLGYAIARFDQNPFVFDNSRVHVSLISYF